MKNNKFCCPKCKGKLSPFYMKQTCPHCGANLLYYQMDKNLEADAQQAEKEVDAVKRFLNILKDSSIKSPLHIVRLIVFFLPLASMCLPMFWAGHKNVSLITFVMCIVNHGFDFGAMLGDLDYFLAVLSMVLVIVLSLVVIIGSLFSATKKGFRRNYAFSLINTGALGLMSILVCFFGGRAMAGFYLTMALYTLDFLLHFLVEDKKTKKKSVAIILSSILCLAIMVASLAMPKPAKVVSCYAGEPENIRVVSFNVASAFGTKFEDTDSQERCYRFMREIQDVDADLVGTQETNPIWCDILQHKLEGYEIYSVQRGGDGQLSRSETNAILWKNETFEIVDADTFWLSETPYEESKFSYTNANGETEEAACNRICTFAILRERATDKLVLFMNTHLDNSSQQARNYGVGLILEKITALRAQFGDIKVIVTGDFNCTIDDDALKDMQLVLKDTTNWDNAKATYQEWGYRQTGDTPIDYIFTNAESENYTILDNLSNGYISDHYGVMVDIK